MRAIGGAYQQLADAQLEVLWVGEPLAALDALERFGLRVTLSPPERCAEHVASRAPDMIVLSGLELAHADALMSELRRQSPGSTIPVITISRDAVSAKPPAGRAGIVARLSAELSANTLAAEIHARLSELAAGSSQREVALAWYELDAWLASTIQDRACGLLVSNEPPLAIAFGASGQFAPSTDALRAAFADEGTDEPRRMRFLELAPSRLLVLTRAQTGHEAADLSGAHVVVVHPDAAQGEACCSALAEAGADAHLVGVDPDELATVPGFAPTLLVMAASALGHGPTFTLWEDARLASVSWLVVDDSKEAAITPRDLVGPAAALVATTRRLQQRLGEGELIVERIESLGAAGWLKEVGRSARSLTLILLGVAGRSEISLAAGKVREATFAPSNGGPAQAGRAALQAALAMPFGKVLVGPHDAVLAREAALPLERAQRIPTPANVDEQDSNDFQERPTASKMATLKPAQRRSYRPSSVSGLAGKAKPASGTGRVVQLKSPTTPSLTASAPPRVSAAPPVPSVPVAPPVPSPALIAESAWAQPAGATEPQPPVLTTTHEQTAVPRLATAATPELASSLSEQIAADIEGALTGTDAAEEPTELQDKPRQRTRWPLVVAAVAMLACATAIVVVRPRSSEVVLSAERIVEELRHALGPTREPAQAATPIAAVHTPRAEAPPVPTTPLPALDVPADVGALKAPATTVEQAPVAEPPHAERAAPPAAEPQVPEDTQAAEAVQAGSPSAKPPALEGTRVADAVQVPPLEAPNDPSPNAQAGEASAIEAQHPDDVSTQTAQPEQVSFDVLLARAKRARERSHDEEAQALLARALELEPNDFGARYQMALTLVRLRRFAEALGELDKAGELEPESALPWLLRGDVYLQQGTLPKALSAWTRCLELRPELEACGERIGRWKVR